MTNLDSIRAGTGEDVAGLERFLREAAFPDVERLTIAQIRRPQGGMSWETFFVRLDLGDGDDQRWIVIKRAPGDVGPDGGTVDHTYARLREQ